jgi:hypothetical protein
MIPFARAYCFCMQAYPDLVEKTSRLQRDHEQPGFLQHKSDLDVEKTGEAKWVKPTAANTGFRLLFSITLRGEGPT